MIETSMAPYCVTQKRRSHDFLALMRRSTDANDAGDVQGFSVQAIPDVNPVARITHGKRGSWSCTGHKVSGNGVSLNGPRHGDSTRSSNLHHIPHSVSQIHMGAHQLSLSWCGCLVVIQCFIGLVDFGCHVWLSVNVRRKTPSGFSMGGLANTVMVGPIDKLGFHKATSRVEMISGSSVNANRWVAFATDMEFVQTDAAVWMVFPLCVRPITHETLSIHNRQSIIASLFIVGLVL